MPLSDRVDDGFAIGAEAQLSRMAGIVLQNTQHLTGLEIDQRDIGLACFEIVCAYKNGSAVPGKIDASPGFNQDVPDFLRLSAVQRHFHERAGCTFHVEHPLRIGRAGGEIVVLSL